MKKTSILVFPILLLSFLLRLYKVENPIADWHSWRQADTAAVARNFAQGRINFLYPQSDSFLALNDKGLENPNRYFINEFPFYNAIVALLFKNFGPSPIFGRLVSIFFAVLGTYFLYLLSLRLFNQKIALLASIFYAVNPYNVYYGRVIMPDPTFVSLSIIALYLFLLWVEDKKLISSIAFALVFALAMLVKPYAIFLTIPIFYWLIINWSPKEIIKPRVLLPLILSFIPLILWRYHMHLHPEGQFASKWLLNEGNIRFKGSFFRWLIFDRLNRLIFSTGGFVLFVVGLARSIQTKNGSLIFVWTASVALYMTIFAKGNINHDYYQLPIVAPGSVLVSLAFFWLIELGKNRLQKTFNFLLATSLIFLSFGFGWYETRGFFNVNHWEFIEAGQAVDRLTPKDALVIAPNVGDPAFLYQTGRFGWPIGGDIDSLIKKGATHYVSVNFDDETNRLMNQYQVIEKTNKYVIIAL